MSYKTEIPLLYYSANMSFCCTQHPVALKKRFTCPVSAVFILSFVSKDAVKTLLGYSFSYQVMSKHAEFAVVCIFLKSNTMF